MHRTDVRVVKETVLRSVDESRLGSIPSPCSIPIPCSNVRDERLHSMGLRAEHEPLEGIGCLCIARRREVDLALHVFL